MSRRAPNAAADRASQNQQTIKTLLKLEGNKSCADCKRNKHPRWASWNLGVFICIRCSGIHRGMGTHVSRVKSVDLDAWTDEQLQRVLQWGNSRANKYWEAKLAPGHVPSEAKIENFIRTKYDSKRWVMDGPMPDPSTLDDDGDEDIPLSVVQEKQKLDRSNSTRASAATASARAGAAAPMVDLFGDDNVPAPESVAPPRPSTGDSSVARQPPPKSSSVPPRATRPGESLLGLDFLGSSGNNGSPSAASATTGRGAAAPAAPSRPDLKQSILSLYASAPRPQETRAQPPSSAAQSTPSPRAESKSAFGGLNDAFSGLSFGASSNNAPAPAPAKTPNFANLGSFTQKASPTVASTAGGSFFDPAPPPPPKNAPLAARPTVSGGGDLLGGFGDLGGAPPAPVKGGTMNAPSAGLNDLFDLNSTVAPTESAKPAAPAPTTAASSVFNLSSNTTHAPASAASSGASKVKSPTAAGWANNEGWGSDDVWASSEPAPAKTNAGSLAGAATTAPTTDFGWGSSAEKHSPAGNGKGAMNATISGPPTVSADEDFGGWSSAAPETTPSTNSMSFSAKPPSTGAGTAGGGTGNSTSGFGGSDDLFSNVWE